MALNSSSSLLGEGHCSPQMTVCSQDPKINIFLKSLTTVTVLPQGIPQKVGANLSLSKLYQTSPPSTLSSSLSLLQQHCQVALLQNAGQMTHMLPSWHVQLSPPCLTSPMTGDNKLVPHQANESIYESMRTSATLPPPTQHSESQWVTLSSSLPVLPSIPQGLLGPPPQ